MSNNPIHIKVESEEELRQMAAEAIHFLVNLRHYQKRWEGEYGHGSQDLINRKHWEKRADEFLEKIQVPKTHQPKQIKIETIKTEQ